MGSSDGASDGGAAMMPRHPLLTLVAAVACFVLLDAALFRSGLYARLSSAVSIQGVASRVVRFEAARPPSGQREVLVLGNSKEDYGLFRFQDRLNSGPYRFIQGSAGAAHERAWYMFARAMDPGRDRYAAIVIPPQSYRVPSGEYDLFSNVQDVWEVSPEMSLSDWVVAIRHAADPVVRRKLMGFAAFASRQYSQDLVDLLLHPVERVRQIAFADSLQGQWRAGTTQLTPDGKVDWTAYEPWHSIADFRRDPATNRILRCPDHMPQNLCETYNAAFRVHDPATAHRDMLRSADYATYWLGKLLKLYANSRTRIIFVQVPRWPTPLPSEPVLSDAVDLQSVFGGVRNVTFMPEGTFEDLEAPENFFDADHMTPEAGAVFTDRFRRAVTDVLDGGGSTGAATLAGAK